MVFGNEYENCPKIEEKRYFTKLTSKTSIINRKPPIWFQDKLFDETYFEMSYINRKPLILSQDMLIMKFELKNCANLVLGKVYENCPKIEEKRYFTKLTSKRVILTENPPKLS